MKRSLGAQVMPLPAPVWCIGTYDDAGRANMMTASWAGICCSDPPCLAVSIRRACHSHASVIARKAFTVNVPGQDQARIADYWGMVSGRDVDKLAAVGLVACRAATVDAPYVEEFPVVFECRLRATHELGLHTQFVGEVLDLRIDETMVDAAGHCDADRVRPFVLIDGYRGLGTHLGRPFSMGKEG